MTQTIFFNDVLPIVLNNIKKTLPVLNNDVILIRDVFGRIRIILEGEEGNNYPRDAIGKLASDLHQSLGVYASRENEIIMFSSAMFTGDFYLKHPDRQLIETSGNHHIWLLDRQIIGQDWTRPLIPKNTKNQRITFYGIKGGVGRSTTLAIWAWTLAKKGKKVLIIDLDLESPGISRTLLPEDLLPEWGVVDWFIEDAVGNTPLNINDMTARSPIEKNLPGSITIAPCFGSKTGDYLPKLSRCYMDPPGRPSSWAERLNTLVESFEAAINPDIVIFDSRAGIHDIAAITITRMHADVFLFAVDSPQTWTAYSFLFKNWKNYPPLKELRYKIQMVACQVPETQRDEYLSRFTKNSWALFSEHLYDVEEQDAYNSFNFNEIDPDAPHFPIPVYWSRALQEFFPCNNPSGLGDIVINEAMKDFVTEADKFINSVEE